MPRYVAFLGHQPQLSLAELAATVPGFSLQKIQQQKIAFFESSEALAPAFLKQLGGTVVLAEHLADSHDAMEDVPKILKSAVKSVKGKVTFGLRTAGLSGPVVKDLYRKSKNLLRQREIPSRYVGGPGKAALAVVLHDEGMLDGKHGCEITVLAATETADDAEATETANWIGRTIAAQDIDAYTKRDMRKPVRDTTVGLLPPKLAQILLNLGHWLVLEAKGPDALRQGKKERPLVVLDPFCGTGVIPMETILRGWTILASDVSLKAVNGCEKNLDWLRKEEKILKKDVPSTVWKQDAAKPFALKQLPDVVVTETSLGPPITARPTLKDIARMKSENEKLQAAFLQNAAATLRGVPLVCTWPVWYAQNDQIFLEKIWDVVGKAGYQATLPPGIQPTIAGRVSLLYRRPDQFVGREIVLLKPMR